MIGVLVMIDNNEYMYMAGKYKTSANHMFTRNPSFFFIFEIVGVHFCSDCFFFFLYLDEGFSSFCVEVTDISS